MLSKKEFSHRFRASFIDPAFTVENSAISRLEGIACGAYLEGRKAPFTTKAGNNYADPTYELSDEWLATKKNIDKVVTQTRL